MMKLSALLLSRVEVWPVFVLVLVVLAGNANGFLRTDKDHQHGMTDRVTPNLPNDANDDNSNAHGMRDWLHWPSSHGDVESSLQKENDINELGQTTTSPNHRSMAEEDPTGSSKKDYFVDWTILKCVMDCIGQPPCGGEYQSWQGQKYTTWEECCERNLSFLPPDLCHLEEIIEATLVPTELPSLLPSSSPSLIPSMQPTKSPSNSPTLNLSLTPSEALSTHPSSVPSPSPTYPKSVTPSNAPTQDKSVTPSHPPSASPIPSALPTERPTEDPTSSPTFFPTFSPTIELENKETQMISASFHLILILDPADIVYGEQFLVQSIEDIVLDYLQANIGGENRFTPVSISTLEVVSMGEQVGLDANDIYISTVLHLDTEFKVKVAFLKWLDTQHGQEQSIAGGKNRKLGKSCSYRNYFECCEGKAINKDPSVDCISKGCTSNRCAILQEKKDKKKNKQRYAEELCSPDEDEGVRKLTNYNEDLLGKDFLDVLRTYTRVKPKKVSTVVNATDSQKVAACTVNRFIDDSGASSFACDKYNSLECAENEDILISSNSTLCHTSVPSSAPSFIPSIQPSLSGPPTNSFSPTLSPTTLKPTRKPVESQLCSSNSECISRKCAYESYSPDSGEVCCSSGESVEVYTRTADGWPTNGNRNFCRYQQLETLCGEEDLICASKACVRGLCALKKVPNDEDCTSDNDCISQKCAYESFDIEAKMVCCSSGDDWRHEGRNICRYQKQGSSCGTYDVLCKSEACVEGKCASSKKGNNEECGVDNDCVSRKCAIASFSPLSQLTCCASGDSVGMYTDTFFGWPTRSLQKFCSHQEHGTLCGGNDDMCASKACVLGRCAPSKLESSSPCRVGNDCISGFCGLDAFDIDAELRCCAFGRQGVYTQVYDGWPTSETRYFCTNMPVNTSCYDDEMCDGACVRGRCESSKAPNDELCTKDSDCISKSCAFENFSSSAAKICCGSGDAASIDTSTSDGWPSSGTRYFCTLRENGSYCGSKDSLCSSDACIGGKCAPEKASNGDDCSANNDCLSQRCAYSSFEPSASEVCCSSGRAVGIYTGTNEGWSSSLTRYFCTHQKSGVKCGDNDSICEGICIDGLCTAVHHPSQAPSTSQSPSLSPTYPIECAQDSECPSNACAYNAYAPNATKVCCASQSIEILTSVEYGWDTSGYRYFCQDMDIGTQCGTQVSEFDDICTSGNCVNGVCSATKTENGGGCIRDDNCISHSCAYDSYFPASSLSCCMAGKAKFYTTIVDGWPSNENRYFCKHQANGSSCKVDEICSSSACVLGQCMPSKAAYGDTCGDHSDCISSGCAYSHFGPDATMMCCSSSHTTKKWTTTDDGWLSNGYRYFCSYQQLGSLCGSDDSLCESNACVGGICASEKLDSSQFCAIDQDCKSSSCAYDVFGTEASLVCCSESAKIKVHVSEDDGWPSDGYRYFCYQPDGASCDSDDICESHACVGGKCASSKVVIDQECDVDSDCMAAERCAFSSFHPDAKMVCCGEVQSTYTYARDGWPFSSTRQFCLNRKLGTLCGESHDLCASKACVEGKCAIAKISNGEMCQSNGDCQSNACGLEAFRSDARTICCASGSRYSIETHARDGWPYSGNRYFCTDNGLGTACGVSGQLCNSNACVGGVCAATKLSTGEVCSWNGDCHSGACGLEAFRTDAETVCCASRSRSPIYTYATDGWPYSGNRYFCTDLRLGAACGGSPELCKSNACIGGLCAQTRISNGEVCSINSECHSNACGLEAFRPDARNVCCASGSRLSLKTEASDGWPNSAYRTFCTNQKIGSACGENDSLCMSDACVSGYCAVSKVEHGGECTLHSDCQSNECAYESYSPTAPLVCCAHGGKGLTTYAKDGWPYNGSRRFCLDQPLGTMCGVRDEICASTSCVYGKCAASKLPNMEECGIDNDCQSDICAYESFDPAAKMVCCASREKRYAEAIHGWPFNGDRYFCVV